VENDWWESVRKLAQAYDAPAVIRALREVRQGHRRS
jgi:hypothetical protein